MAHDVYVKWTYTFNVHWSWIMNLTCLCRLHMHLSNEQFVHLAWILFVYSFNIVMLKMQIIFGFDIWKLIWHVCANLNVWMSNKQIVIWHLEAYLTSLCQIAHVNVEWPNCDLTLKSLFDKFMSSCTCECRMNTLFCICDNFPKGNLHFQINVGTGPAITFNILYLQLPRFLIVVNQLLETNILVAVLKSFLRFNATDLNLLEGSLPRL
jgi:hypothetical protein